MKRDVAESTTSPEDLVDLRAFCFVVDLGSITKAAAALGESKGSVSRRLTRLERVLGVELLRRSPRLVQATEDGVAYRVRVGRALELLDDASSQVQNARSVPSGHLRVTAPFDLAVTTFAPLVVAFAAAHPAVSIELLLTDALLDFDTHQIDIALRAASSLQDSALIGHKLTDIEAGLFASPAYLKTHRAPRRAEDLEGHRMLLARATRGRASLTLWRRGEEKTERVSVRAAISASDFAFAKEAAVAGGGVAALPTLITHADVAAKRLVRVLPDLVLLDASLYLLHPASRFLTPKVRAFRDAMIAAFDGASGSTPRPHRGTRAPR